MIIAKKHQAPLEAPANNRKPEHCFIARPHKSRRDPALHLKKPDPHVGLQPPRNDRTRSRLKDRRRSLLPALRRAGHFEFVADAPDGLEAPLRGDVFDLLAQALDVHVDGAAVAESFSIR